jgi:6-phosphogluconolactonase
VLAPVHARRLKAAATFGEAGLRRLNQPAQVGLAARCRDFSRRAAASQHVHPINLSVFITLPFSLQNKEHSVSDSAIVYIGTYTQAMGHVDGTAGGVEVYRLHRGAGRLEHLGTARGAENPSFVTLSADGRFLYAVQELGEFEGQAGGGASAFTIDEASGMPALLNSQPVHGAAPCYLTIDRSGRWLVTANYSGGNVTVLPILADGSLGEAVQVVQHAGAGMRDDPHPHAAVWTPSGDMLLVPDCGLNQIYLYRFDAEQGRLTPHDPPTAALPPSSGPRHLAFDPTGRYLYCVNEYGSSVTAFAYDAERGALSELHTLSALPAGFEGRNSGADIHVSRDGRFVYASMRGHDSLAVFRADTASGRLTAVGHVSTQGRTPRNFALDPASDLVLAANQDSSTVAFYRVDAATGMPVPTGYVVDVPTPVCVHIAG